MAEDAHHNPQGSNFAEFLRHLPESSGTVTVVGTVARGGKEGSFLFTPAAGGPPREIPVDAVKHHHVVYTVPARTVVKLELDQAHAAPAEGGASEQELLFQGGGFKGIADKAAAKDPIAGDPIHKLHKDVPDDRIGPLAAYAPFVLATPHHAPQAPLAYQAAGLQQQFAPRGGALHKTILETLKEAVKDGVADTLKEHYKDPITDTLKEHYKDPITDGVATLVEGGGTLAENAGIPINPLTGLPQT